MASSKKKPSAAEQRRRAVNSGLYGSGAYQHGNWGSSTPGASGFWTSPTGGGLMKVIDVISRPLYMMAEGQERLFNSYSQRNEPGAPPVVDFKGGLQGAWAGLSGKKKTTYSDVLANAGGPASKGKANTIAGLGADVLLDPITWITFGAAPVVKGAAAGATRSAARSGARDIAGTAARKALPQGGSRARKIAEEMAGGAARPHGGPAIAGELLENVNKARPHGGPLRELAGGLDELPPGVVPRPHGGPMLALPRSAEEFAETMGRVGSQRALPAGAAAGLPAPLRGLPASVAGGLDELGDLAARQGFTPPPGGWRIPTAGALPAGAHLPAEILEDAGRAGFRGARPHGGMGGSLPRGASRATGGAGSAARTAAGEAGRATTARLGDDVAKEIQLRFAGKRVVGSQAAYRGLKATGAGIKATKAGNLLSETFRPAHGVSKEFHDLSRMYSGRAQSLIGDVGEKIREMVKGLTKDEDRWIRDAINGVNGKTLDGLPTHLRPVADWMKGVLDEMDRVGGVSRSATNPSKFKDYTKFKGSTQVWDRASQNLLHQFDEFTRGYAHKELLNEAARRWPADLPQIEQALRRAKHVFGVQGENTAAWQHYINSVQGPWKRYVTAYRPGFHIRNMLGDSFNNYLAGVNPMRYKTAGAVMKGLRDDATIKLGRHTFKASELDNLYRRAGLDTSYFKAEQIDRAVTGFGHRVTQMSEAREKFGRMANFLDGLEKGLNKGKSLERAMEEAGARTRKYLFDYADLTGAERKLRSVIPFYTWTRKELPLILEHTLTTPGMMAAVPKGTRALSNLLGVDADPDDPFPDLEADMPEWLRDKLNIAMPGGNIASPGLPFDLLGMVSSPKSFGTQVAENVSPFITGPLELTTGKNFPSGTPQRQSLPRYVLGNYAPYGTLARENDTPMSERLWNIIHGMGYRHIS